MDFSTVVDTTVVAAGMLAVGGLVLALKVGTFGWRTITGFFRGKA